MRWARVAVVLGVLLVLAAFAVGTEVRPVVRLDRVPVTCPATIPARWLVAGSPSTASGDPRLEGACRSRERLVHAGFGVTLGVGAVVLLVGWSALREGGSRSRYGPGSGAGPVATAAQPRTRQ